MSEKMKTLRKYIAIAFFILVGAFAFFVATYFIIWDISDGNRLVAYIFNGLFILIATTEDKVRFYFLEKRKDKPSPKRKWLGALYDNIVLEKYNLSSIKSSLYLFYIFALVTSHILILMPQLDVLDSTRSYFSTIGYALIILIAVDKFIEQFMKDDKRIKNYEKTQKPE